MWKVEYWWLLLLLLLGSFIGGYQLGEGSFTIDEASSFLTVERLNQTGELDEGDSFHPPGFFHWLSAWDRHSSGGSVEFWGRMSSFIFYLPTLLVLFLFGWDVRDRRTGLYLVLLFALSPFALLLFREARPYGPLLFFASSSLLFFYRFITYQSRFALVGLFLAGSIGMFFHYSLIVFLIGLFGYGLFWLGTSSYRRSFWLIGTTICMGATTLFWKGAWLADATALLSRATFQPPGQFPFGVFGFWGYTLYCMILGETVYPWTWSVTVPAFLITASLFLDLSYQCFRTSQKRWLYSFILFMGLFPVVFWGGFPDASVRYAAAGLPCLLLVMVLALQRISRKLLQGGVLLGLVVLFGYADVNLLTGQSYHHIVYREPSSRVADLIEQEWKRSKTWSILSQPHVGIRFYVSDNIPLGTLQHSSEGFRIQYQEDVFHPKRFLRDRKAWKQPVMFIVRTPGERPHPQRIMDQNRQFIAQCKSMGFTVARKRELLRDPLAQMKKKYLGRTFSTYRFRIFLMEPPD